MSHMNVTKAAINTATTDCAVPRISLVAPESSVEILHLSGNVDNVIQSSISTELNIFLLFLVSG